MNHEQLAKLKALGATIPETPDCPIDIEIHDQVYLNLPDYTTCYVAIAMNALLRSHINMLLDNTPDLDDEESGPGVVDRAIADLERAIELFKAVLPYTKEVK